MAGVRVMITDPTGRETHRAELPHDVPMHQLIPALLRRLRREIIGSDGQLANYRLYFNNREIGRDERLADVGVSEGSTLTLSHEGHAATGHE